MSANGLPSGPVTDKSERMRKAIDFKGNCEVEQAADGGWTGRFPPFDLEATGATEEECRGALRDAMMQLLSEGDEDVQRRWQEWAESHVIDVEISEEEYQQELAERQRAQDELSSAAPQLTPDTFDAEIASSTPTLVDYWAAWCGPCRMMSPILHDVASKFEGRMRLFGVDVEAHKDLWERFDLRGIPTFILFRDGKEVGRIVGAMPLDEFVAELEPLLG
jgi:thioredoxin